MPHFKHYCDCGDCKFLTSYQNDRQYDLYYCLVEGKYPSLFARFGNEPTDVEAMPASLTTPPAYVTNESVRFALMRAQRCAQEQNLIP